MKPIKCQAREENEARKAKKRGGEKAKSRSQDCCVKPKVFAFYACPNFAR